MDIGSIGKLGIDELRSLENALGLAADHHSDSPRTHNLAALANTVAPITGKPGFAQGILENPAVVALLQALVALAMAKLTAPKPEPAPPVVVAPPTTGPVPEPPPPPGPPAGLVSRLILKATRIMPPRRHDNPATPEDDRVPREFVVEDEDGSLRFTDGGPTSMDDGSVVTLELDIVGQNGQGLRVDLDPSVTPPGQVNHPELLGRFRFEAFDPQTRRTLGAIGGLGLDDNGHVEGPVHFLDPQPPKGPGAFRRSGGVVAECAVRQTAAFRVVDTLDGVTSNTIYGPEVR